VRIACALASAREVDSRGSNCSRSSGEEIPKITGSQAFKNGGALFITWDEGDEDEHDHASDGPIGMIVLSPRAKKNFGNDIAYDHSSTLRTFETIFGLPLLRGAQHATDLGDLFQP
jgi:hypothetical protein